MVFCSFDPGTMYVILRSWFCLPPLQRQHNVCYFLFPTLCPAAATPAQRMLFYVPNLISCLFDPSTMYVTRCSWFSVLPLQPWRNVYFMFMILYTAPSTLAQCMSCCVPDFFSRPFNASTTYVIVCPWYSILPLQSWQNVCYSMSLTWCAAPSTPA